MPAPLTETPTTSDLSSSAVPTLSSATTTSTSSVLTSPVPPPIQTQGLPNSTETAPTSSLATPTCDATLPTSPSRSVQQDREVQEEAASFLASLSETQTLSPLKFISQHPVPSDISINHVSGVSTATSNSTDPGNTNAPDISGITCSRVDPSNPLFSVVSELAVIPGKGYLYTCMYMYMSYKCTCTCTMYIHVHVIQMYMYNVHVYTCMYMSYKCTCTCTMYVHV